jgi:hypothetical protein
VTLTAEGCPICISLSCVDVRGGPGCPQVWEKGLWGVQNPKGNLLVPSWGIKISSESLFLWDQHTWLLPTSPVGLNVDCTLVTWGTFKITPLPGAHPQSIASDILGVGTASLFFSEVPPYWFRCRMKAKNYWARDDISVNGFRIQVLYKQPTSQCAARTSSPPNCPLGKLLYLSSFHSLLPWHAPSTRKACY